MKEIWLQPDIMKPKFGLNTIQLYKSTEKTNFIDAGNEVIKNKQTKRDRLYFWVVKTVIEGNNSTTTVKVIGCH